MHETGYVHLPHLRPHAGQRLCVCQPAGPGLGRRYPGCDFHLRAPAAARRRLAGHAPAYTSPNHSDDGESSAYVYRLDDCDVLRFTREADFYLWPDRIVCHLLDPACAYQVEIYLLGTVLSFFLERRGIPALHASAAAVGDRAVAFLSGNRGVRARWPRPWRRQAIRCSPTTSCR